MIRPILLISCFVFAMILIGCSKTETANNSNSATTTAEKPAGAGAPASSTSSTAASSGEKIGIPECDEFIAKYDSCAPKVPEVARAQYKSAGTQMRESWKKLADNPQTRASLAAACKTAAENQAAAWKMYGCAN